LTEFRVHNRRLVLHAPDIVATMKLVFGDAMIVVTAVRQRG